MAEPSQPEFPRLSQWPQSHWFLDATQLLLWVSCAGTSFGQASHNRPAGIAFLVAIAGHVVFVLLRLSKADRWAAPIGAASCGAAFVGIVLLCVGWWL
jgi:hypothetical protein